MFGWKPVKLGSGDGLRDIEPGTSYQICNTCECNSCELMYCDIRFHNDDLKRYYWDYQTEEFFKQREMFEASFITRRKSFKPGSGIISGLFNSMNLVEEFITNNGDYQADSGTILDYGGSLGAGSPFSKSKAKKFVYDLDPRVKNKSNFIQKKKFNEHPIDLVVLRNVLEHTPYPRKIIRDITASCKSGTLVYIEVPLERVMMQHGAGTRNLEKKIWHEHINFFTSKSIEKMAKANGLNFVSVKEVKMFSDDASDNDNNRTHLMCLLRT